MYNNLFFFSSRRRHTRLQGDWSSDVCSSDLQARAALGTTRLISCWIEPILLAATSRSTPLKIANPASTPKSVARVAAGFINANTPPAIATRANAIVHPHDSPALRSCQATYAAMSPVNVSQYAVHTTANVSERPGK